MFLCLTTLGPAWPQTHPAVPGQKNTDKQPHEPLRASLQIINACSMPLIDLEIDGRLCYPGFTQGLYTADAPTERLKSVYTVIDPVSGDRASHSVELKPDTRQSLILIGDFSNTAQDDGKKPKTGRGTDLKIPGPSFLVFSHEPAPGEKPLRYRLVNGIPGQVLHLLNGKETVDVDFGKSFALCGQPPVATLHVRVENHNCPVFINQQGTPRNCTVVFYKSEKGYAFMRVFENTMAMLKKMEAQSD